MRGAWLLFAWLIGCTGTTSSSDGDGGRRGDGSVRPLSDGATLARDVGPPPPIEGDPPPIQAELLAVTYVGGSGAQYVREVGFLEDGRIVGQGTGFRVVYEADGSRGAIEGDPATVDAEAYSEKPELLKEWNTNWDPTRHARALNDARTGLTYYWGTRQVHPNLQQPIFLACDTGADCAVAENYRARLWGWWYSLCDGMSLEADSRAYQLWHHPGGLIGVQAWTDGGNSTLARSPLRAEGDCADASNCQALNTRLSQSVSMGTWQPEPNSLSTMLMLIDPERMEPTRATFLRGVHATALAVDPWGRIYVPRAVGRAFPDRPPANVFAHGADADSGIFVLSPDFTTAELNTRLGGSCSGDGTLQVFGSMAIRGNVLVMGGTTCAGDVPTTANAVQAGHGGGQDGFMVVLRLWPD